MADRWPDCEPRHARAADRNHNYNHDIEAAAGGSQRHQPQPLQPLQQPQLHRAPLQYRDTPPPTPQKDYHYRQDVVDRFQPSPSRISRMSRMSRLSLGSRHSLPQSDCMAVECFLRVASAIIASAVIAASAVLYALVKDAHRSDTTVDRINWVIGIPIGATALVWQLARLGLLAATRDTTTTVLLAADITMESVLAVGGVICSVLAGFQAARHSGEREGGCDVALSVLIGLLAIASFGVLAVSFVEENRRRCEETKETPKKEKKEKKQKQKKPKRERRFRHSSDSSVIEIIRR